MGDINQEIEFVTLFFNKTIKMIECQLNLRKYQCLIMPPMRWRSVYFFNW